MNVLVAGGAGFIGSHVVDALLAEGHKVAVLDNFSHGHEANVPRGVPVFRADLANAGAVSEAISTFRPATIMHLAAQKSVSVSVQDPHFDAKENILASLVLFEAAKTHHVERIVFASTGGALYGETEHLPTPESHPTFPESPYGIAKLAVEHYLRFYERNHGIQGIVLRMANVFGPRQDPFGEAGVIAIFCARALAKEPVAIFGDGLQTRDYTYVGDVARAFINALEAPSATICNIGTGHETSVIDLLEAIELVVGHPIERRFEPGRAGEIRRSCLDAALARERLSWQPTVGLHEGLARTVASLREVSA